MTRKFSYFYITKFLYQFIKIFSYLFEKFGSDGDHEYKLQCSYMELYNENGFDLLNPTHDMKQLEDLEKVTVLEDQNGGIKIRNLSTVSIANEEEAINQLFIGDTNRSIAETPMNMASTRGHCIFTLYIEARQPGNALIKRSKAWLLIIIMIFLFCQTSGGPLCR